MATFHSDELVRLARAYCDATGLSMAMLGHVAAGNRSIFVRIAAGKGCHIDSARQASEWLARNWPIAAPWPVGIARPGPEARAA
jgi:hypothetical protein